MQSLAVILDTSTHKLRWGGGGVDEKWISLR